VSFNVHLCLHLTSSVRAWGPLWAHSAFVYEAFNAKLLAMIKGTQAVPLQICKTFALQRSLAMFIARVTASESCTSEYKAIFQSLLPASTRLQQCDQVNGVTLLGRCRLRKLSSNHFVAMHYVVAHIPRETVVQYYDRIIVHGEIVHCNNYCRHLKRNSNTVVLDDESLFSIEHFVTADLGSGPDAYALGNHLHSLPTPICKHSTIRLKLCHLLPVTRTLGPLIAVPAQRIVRKCVFIYLPSKEVDIVCRQLNMFEYCT